MLKFVVPTLLLFISLQVRGRDDDLIISNSQTNETECGPNQVWRVCAIPCLPTCKNPNPPQCRPRVCRRMCQCDWGYVEDENGNCIPPEDCAAKGETENQR